MSVYNTILHECQPQPPVIPQTKVVEAFGFRKCSKLVEQVNSPNIELRNNALEALKDEFLNEQTLYGCIKEGIIKDLIFLLKNESEKTRKLVTNAINSAFKYNIGIEAALSENCIPQFILSLNDDSETVRRNIFQSFVYISATNNGVTSIVRTDEVEVVKILINSIEKEPSCKLSIMKTLYSVISSNEKGLNQALDANAIEVFLGDLSTDTSNSTEIKTLLTKTIGFMCFNSFGRHQTLTKDAITTFAELLENTEDELFISSLLLSLTSITLDDSGKISFYDCIGPETTLARVISLLSHENKSIKLNVMKLFSNVVVYPPSRNVLINNSHAIQTLENYSKSDDVYISKHAKIALDTIFWKP